MNLYSFVNKKLIVIFLFVLLAIAIPITLLLTRSPQDLRQQASEKTSTASGDGLIYGFLYIDTNNNSKIDENEARISQVTLLLKDAHSLSLIHKSYSDINGYYGFGGLDTTKEYIIEVEPREDLFLTDNFKVTFDLKNSSSIHHDFNYQYNDLSSNIEFTDSDLDLNENGVFDKGDVSQMFLCVKERKNCTTNKEDLNRDGLLGQSDDLNIMIRLYNEIDDRRIKFVGQN